MRVISYNFNPITSAYYKDLTSGDHIEFPIGHHETIQLFPQGSCSSEVQLLEIIHTGKKTLILQTYLAWKAEMSNFANIPGGTYSSLSAPLSSTAKIAPTSLVSGWFQQGLQEDSTFCVEQSSAGLLLT